MTGKRVNRGAGYGLEIPAQYQLIGVEKAVEWAEKNIRKVLDSVNNKTQRCTK